MVRLSAAPQPSNPVLVHRLAFLLRASFRPRLATTPLRFTNPSLPSRWVKDFHLQAIEHARHTIKTPPAIGGGFLRNLIFPVLPLLKVVSRWPFQKRAQLPRTRRMPQLAQRLGFNLPDTLARDGE